MRRFFRFLLLNPVLWAANKFSSKPRQQKIFEALSALFENICQKPGEKGPVISFGEHSGKFIIFSDQHKGARNGADDFILAEPNYITALDYYYKNGFTFINLGDSEELWENSIFKIKKLNKANFEAEKKFLANNRYIKVFGNHDLYWDNDPLAWWQLRSIYDEKVKVYEGVVLKLQPGANPQSETLNPELTIFLTHGHQGDASSDGNWFSKFFVANIWAPLQSYLRINPNTPAYDAEKKTQHNHIMYEWSAAQKNLLLITGHTHQPVFASLTHLERLYKQYQLAEHEKNNKELEALKKEIRKREKEFTAVSVDYMNMKASYFNTGCCCFTDGDITGIEIADGCIRLIKWSEAKGREVLEAAFLE
jgi:predicted phosphodiesterase